MEVASELATDYRDKQVTIIHSGPKLCGTFLSDVFHKRLDELMDEMKITRILGEEVNNSLQKQTVRFHEPIESLLSVNT